jgi:hypothetical protein
MLPVSLVVFGSLAKTIEPMTCTASIRICDRLSSPVLSPGARPPAASCSVCPSGCVMCGSSCVAHSSVSRPLGAATRARLLARRRVGAAGASEAGAQAGQRRRRQWAARLRDGRMRWDGRMCPAFGVGPLACTRPAPQSRVEPDASTDDRRRMARLRSMKLTARWNERAVQTAIDPAVPVFPVLSSLPLPLPLSPSPLLSAPLSP